MKKLKDLMPFISYSAKLQIMERGMKGTFWSYIFPKNDIVRRETVERNYLELLERELMDGIHADGNREGIYIHLKTI